jgi:two-component system, response regulator
MTEAALEILLVEDNPNDLKLALHSFHKNHLVNRIHVVRDGAEALDFVFSTGAYADRRGRKPGVILLDLKLPLVDGIEVLRRIKADPATKSIPVVVLTSSREGSDVKECYDLGVNSYIVKPVDFDQFTKYAQTIGVYWLAMNEPPVLKD